jgi:hypothetical protein
MMLHIAPVSWYSWAFKVSDESRTVADIAMSWWREKGALAADGVNYRVYREGLASGAFVLEGPGSVLARAEKPSAFRREFSVRHDGREYTLRPRSIFGRTFILTAGSREIGSVTPHNAFTRKATADLPADLPIPVRAFIVWLVMIAWKRTQDAS